MICTFAQKSNKNKLLHFIGCRNESTSALRASRAVKIDVRENESLVLLAEY